MTNPSLATVDVPATLRNRGQYVFTPQAVRLSGAGTSYQAGEQQAVWTWPYASQAEWDWLKAAWVAAPTAFVLWDDDNVLTSFTSGVMERPVFEKVEAGLYRGVKATFRFLMPLT
jgi:hypothetical protein